jgi:hypothetical protein
MGDPIPRNEPLTEPDILLDPSQYSGDILFYPSENRIDISVLRNSSITPEAIKQGWYNRNQEGPLYLFISPSPLPSEIREQIAQKGLQNDPKFKAIARMYERYAPDDLTFKVTIKTSGSIIPRKFDPKWGEQRPWLTFGFSKAKGGAYFESDLSDKEALFILGLIRDSFTHVLEKGKSGIPEGDTPPRIRYDPLYITMTDEQFDQKVPGMYGSAKDVEKIRHQRENIIPQVLYMQMTAKEIIKKRIA